MHAAHVVAVDLHRMRGQAHSSRSDSRGNAVAACRTMLRMSSASRLTASLLVSVLVWTREAISRFVARRLRWSARSSMSAARAGGGLVPFFSGSRHARGGGGAA